MKKMVVDILRDAVWIIRMGRVHQQPLSYTHDQNNPFIYITSPSIVTELKFSRALIRIDQSIWFNSLW